MRKLLLITMLTVSALTAFAQKTVYIPNEWRSFGPDTLLYAENDPDGRYTWSKTRSVESDNVIIFWDKFYKTAPHELSKNDFYYVDIPDLLNKCEAFFDLEINKLGFVDPEKSNLAKYKVMVLMNHTTTWTCYGGGYDFMVSALWLNPSTCKPVGHSVAHEVGHSFHYMCFAEDNKHTDSSTNGTGFHLPVGNGAAVWEQTAQWQACQSYPEQMFDQSMGVFRNSHNYAFTHEWHRYQSYWFFYYLTQTLNDIKAVANVWNHHVTGAHDFNQSLMEQQGWDVKTLYRHYYEYAARCATWDFDVCAPYRDIYIGDFNYRAAMIADSTYQVALSSTPQATGFNVIPLVVPAAGTEISADFTAIRANTKLADADPAEYLDGDSRLVSSSLGHYSTAGNDAGKGFRLGFVALMKDGTRQYFHADSIYCQGSGKREATVGMTVPANVENLWMIVSPAPKTYFQHKWDDAFPSGDDQWPYIVHFNGTDIDSRSATIYVSPVIDGREIRDITLEYDITIPKSTAYMGTYVTIGGTAASMLGTALQLKQDEIVAKLVPYSAAGPSNGQVMFYAATDKGLQSKPSNTNSTYGHWFNANGTVVAWGSTATIYSDFSPQLFSFYVAQHPENVKVNGHYKAIQALRYKDSNGKEAIARFKFNISIGGTEASYTLKQIIYDDPTGIIDTPLPAHNGTSAQDNSYYDLNGRRVVPENGRLHKGIYIVGGRKVVVP